MPARGAYLQVIGGGLVISELRGLQESKQGSGRRLSAERIGRRGSWFLSLGPTLQQTGHRLGHQSMKRKRTDKNQQRQSFHRCSNEWSATRPRPATMLTATAPSIGTAETPGASPYDSSRATSSGDRYRWPVRKKLPPIPSLSPIALGADGWSSLHRLPARTFR